MTTQGGHEPRNSELRQAIDRARRAQLARAGLEPDHPPRAPWQRIDIDLANRLRDQGWSYPQIARELGCHHTTAMYACDETYRARKRAWAT